MAGLYLFQSNKLKNLSEKISEIISKKPLRDPFSEEIFITGSYGTERWLSLEIAKHNSISGNTRFYSPREFLNHLSGNRGGSVYEHENLRWAIIRVLKEGLLEEKEFITLKKYGENFSKLYQLAGKIARIFDSYFFYRPNLPEYWERGELLYEENKNEVWQKILWQSILKYYGNTFTYPGKLRKAFTEKYIYNYNKEGTEFELPERIFIFGIKELPPCYIEFFREISKKIEVYFFLLNPSPHYRKKKKEEGGYNQNLLWQNSREKTEDFFSLIYELPFDCREELYEEPSGNKNLLNSIQRDIFLCDSVSGERKALDEEDESVKIVSSYSPGREVEVLYDYLLDMFARDRSLKPRHITVMAPDIEKYRPYIDALFGSACYERKIPYSITDVSIKDGGPVADILLKILSLEKSRFEVSGVIEILESEPVYRCFGLEGHLDLIRKWIEKLNIKWGINGKYKEDMGLPSFEENTWEGGLKRMLLGYAMPGGGEDFFADILPFDDIEGSNGQILGKFLEFIETLFETVKELKYEKSLSQWALFCKELISSFFFTGRDTEEEILQILNIIKQLEEHEEITGFKEKIPSGVLNMYFAEHFRETISHRGFITGGVTFCSIIPERVIPFRVICLLGMNDEAYPRKEITQSFNLMKEYPRKGDETRRDADRYFLLETLVSAEERFYISYVGRSIKDNTRLLPSVPIKEFADYIHERYKIPPPLITEHPFHSFSPLYFEKGSKFFTYSKEDEEAAKCYIKSEKETEERETDLEIDEKLLSVSIKSLCDFFKNPAKYFLTKRLNLYFTFNEKITDEREHFKPDALDRYIMVNDLIFYEEKEKYFRRIKEEGILPHGKPGKLSFKEVAQEADKFREIISLYREKDKKLPPLDIDIKLEVENLDFYVKGKIDEIYEKGLVFYRPVKKPKGKDLIETWIYHVLINMKGYKIKSYFTGKEVTAIFRPVENPMEIFKDLLRIYLKGIRGFIPFAPEASLECAKEFVKKEDCGSAFKVFAVKLDDAMGGEKSNPYFNMCFKKLENFYEKEEFKKETCNLAVSVFRKLFLYYEEEKPGKTSAGKRKKKSQ